MQLQPWLKATARKFEQAKPRAAAGAAGAAAAAVAAAAAGWLPPPPLLLLLRLPPGMKQALCRGTY